MVVWDENDCCIFWLVSPDEKQRKIKKGKKKNFTYIGRSDALSLNTMAATKRFPDFRMV